MSVDSIDDAAFARLLADLGPFEAAPLLAVAVSGGADSLALTVLADAWARARGGRVVALTVDHGLRAEAAAEARRVAGWMAERGIEHHILSHDGPRPDGDIQAAARTLRYRLLLDACGGLGCLHLLLAHHRDDQAETLLLRLARGSGVVGLAGMAVVTSRPEARLLRPLLDVPKTALEAFLRRQGQAWVRDPSNSDPGFARVRLRRSAAVLAEEGLNADRLAATARRLGRARQALEAAADDLLARAAVLDPRGWAWLDPAPLRTAPEETALRVLADLLSAIGGRDHPPREERLLRLMDDLGTAATLHGCRLVPRQQRLLVVREARGLPTVGALSGPASIVWDGRFRLRLATGRDPLAVGPLMEAGWAEVADGVPEGLKKAVPVEARASLPALFDGKGLLSVPHLGYNRDQNAKEPTATPVESLLFAPIRAAGSLGFRLERSRSRIM